ncbi:SRPBCC family protein [Paenibacillus athensensis]|uniref:Cell division protein n=1 Tax=Paenibacillus athensensis TaxID=1967502 RepID=A0A4Y8PYY4_9BACL|nr:SRPBCC family protein [Paenibacillus athensensis]MCD1260423.1 SRPBCC family protein [Paenibacillus athensensis]
MPVIRLEFDVAAPPSVCFDLSRSIDLHMASTAPTNEVAIAGRTSGLIGLGETVTWEATHFAIRQRLTSEITAFESPVYFVNEMVSGAFKRFRHEHRFESRGEGTLMTDIFDYTSPLGPLGRLADALFLYRYMKRLLVRRNLYIKQAAESGLV